MTETTEPATPPAEPDVERAAYKNASALMARIVDQLKTLPRSTAVVGDLTGFRVRLNFGTNEPAGVLEFAAIADTELNRDSTIHGCWLEARATIEGIPVCAEALLSPEAAAVFEKQSPPPNPSPDNDAQPSVRPVPLGDSVLAHVPAVTPMPPVNTKLLDVEDVARCVRCGCTDAQVCEGGCYWVANRQMVDLCSACATPEELRSITFTVAADSTGGGE
ncbi:hypothetical protein [Streptomyces sp. bgisy034]|uniref:hypothetical protein n=1 Tax=Streptomyces sp. bgisy034 TaxID=3413774 RepID=UPI003EB8E57E